MSRAPPFPPPPCPIWNFNLGRFGYGSKLHPGNRTAGLSPCVHLPGKSWPFFGVTLFLSPFYLDLLFTPSPQSAALSVHLASRKGKKATGWQVHGLDSSKFNGGFLAYLCWNQRIPPTCFMFFLQNKWGATIFFPPWNSTHLVATGQKKEKRRQSGGAKVSMGQKRSRCHWRKCYSEKKDTISYSGRGSFLGLSNLGLLSTAVDTS